MPKITNTTDTPFRLPLGALVDKRSSVVIPTDLWDKQKNHRVVKAWLETEALVVGKGEPKADKAQSSKTPADDKDGEGADDDSQENGDDGEGDGDGDGDGEDVTDAEEQYRALTNAELAKLINAKKPGSTKIGMTKDELVSLAIELEA